VFVKNIKFDLFDKALLSTVGSIEGLFLLVKGYFAGIFCIEKQGLAMRLGTESGASAALYISSESAWPNFS